MKDSSKLTNVYIGQTDGLSIALCVFRAVIDNVKTDLHLQIYFVKPHTYVEVIQDH